MHRKNQVFVSGNQVCFFCGIQVCIKRIKFAFRGIKFAFCGIKFASKESSLPDTMYQQGPVSRTSQYLFGPEKPVVKLQSTCFKKLIFVFNVRKTKRTVKSEGSDRRQGNYGTRDTPETFRAFEKQAQRTLSKQYKIKFVSLRGHQMTSYNAYANQLESYCTHVGHIGRRHVAACFKHYMV